MSKFKTKAGRALEAMFDESRKNEITNPNARPNPKEDGTFCPYDRTAKGVIYSEADDEKYVDGGPKL